MLGSVLKHADAVRVASGRRQTTARWSRSWLGAAALSWATSLAACTPPKEPDVPEEDEPLIQPSPPRARAQALAEPGRRTVALGALAQAETPKLR